MLTLAERNRIAESLLPKIDRTTAWVLNQFRWRAEDQHTFFNDCRQEACVALLEALDRYENLGAKPWTYAEKRVRGAIIDFLRKQGMINGRTRKKLVAMGKPVPTVVSLEASEVFRVASTDPSPEEIVQTIRVREFVRTIMTNCSTMSERETTITQQYFIDGKTLDEIGKGLGLAETTICANVKRSVPKLRAFLRRMSIYSNPS